MYKMASRAWMERDLNRRNHFGILVIAALAFGTAMPLAHADDVDDCNGDLPAFVVKGCSAIIADSNTSEDNLEAAYVARGRAYDQFEKWDEALADLTKATELNPRDANAWSNRGAVNEHCSDPEMAVKDYDKSISLDPKNAGTYFNRGNADRL